MGPGTVVLAAVLSASAPKPVEGLDGGVPRPRDLGMLADIMKRSAPDGGSLRPRFKWSVPELEHSIDVPSTQLVNGLPVRFSAAVSRASPEVLLRYYVDEFNKAGLYVPPPADQLASGGGTLQVTALDSDNLVSYTVILQVASEKLTTVIMGESQLEPWMRGKGMGDDFAPLLPQAEAVVRSRGEGIDMLQYVVEAEPAAVRAFYGDVLKKAGYAQPEPDLFVRGAERISLRLVRSPNKAAAKKTVVQLQRGVGAPVEEPAP